MVSSVCQAQQNGKTVFYKSLKGELFCKGAYSWSQNPYEPILSEGLRFQIEPGTHHLAQTGLELKILLLQPLKCRDYKM